MLTIRPQRCLSMELDHLLGAEVGGSQIGIEHGVPVGALHAHDQLVAGDAGVVNQDVNLAELRERSFEGGFDLVFFRHVE